MMNKILVFRTDRIGDLLITCPAIITIKESLPNSKITLVSSNKNYEYAKKLNIFDQIYKFPNVNLINKLKFIYKFTKIKFDYTFAFDGKGRSIISTALINSRYKVALAPKINPLYKIFKIKFFKDSEDTNLNDIFQKSLNYCQINTKIHNYDFLNKKKNNNFSSNIPIKNYLHIHLDEKWFSDLYIKKYTNIYPDFIGFIDFLNNIPKQNHILITTGIIDFNLIDDLKNKYFKKINQKVFFQKNLNRSIYLVYKPTFDDLESLLRNSKILISCHGAITHAANSFSVKSIDIIEESREKFYKRFTSYLKNYTYTYRRNFNTLKTNLLNIIGN